MVGSNLLVREMKSRFLRVVAAKNQADLGRIESRGVKTAVSSSDTRPQGQSPVPFFVSATPGERLFAPKCL
jgi:hypothetical protein